MFHLEGVTANSFKLTKIINPDDPKDCVVFDGKGFSGSSFRARDTEGRICTFVEINDYIRKHMIPADRTALYKAYVDIDNYFDNSNQLRRKGNSIVDTFDAGLVRHLSKIINVVKYKDVKEYFMDLYKAGLIRIPEDIHDDYRIDDKLQQKHIDCTYRTPDYLETMALSLYLRLMIPVWGRYLPITRYENKYNLKEYYALRLLEGTSLFKEHVFSRLDTYIRGVVTIEDDLAVMVSGLSNEEIPFFLMSQIVVKRLPIFSISYDVGADRNQHLMSMMFHLIGKSGKTGKLGHSLKSVIFEKKPIENEWSDEDNSSVIDMYKARELVSGGDLTVTEVYLMQFCQGDDPELTKLCHEYILGIDLQSITQAQIQLMTWIMSVLIPGNVIPLFEGPVLRRALAIAQSQLYTWNFSELAILLTAEPIPLEKDMFVGSMDHKAITADRRTELDRIYGVGTAATTRIENVGVRAIQEISRKMFDTDWGVNCPKILYQDNEELNISPIFGTPGNLRNQLADLLVKLS